VRLFASTPGLPSLNLAMAPLFLWDVLRHRSVHRAYRVWIGLFLPFAIATFVLWDTAGWHAFAARLLGP